MFTGTSGAERGVSNPPQEKDIREYFLEEEESGLSFKKMFLFIDLRERERNFDSLSHLSYSFIG